MKQSVLKNLIALAREVSSASGDAVLWASSRPHLQAAAGVVVAELHNEDAVASAARAGLDTIHTDSGRTPPPHNPGGFPGT